MDLDVIRKTLEGHIEAKGDETPTLVLQTYLLLKILDRLESIDDSLVVLMNTASEKEQEG